MVVGSQLAASAEITSAFLIDPTAVSVLDQMPTGVVVVDRVGTVRYANELVLRLLGWEPDAYVGRSLLDVIVPDDLAFVAELIADGQSYFGRTLGPMRVRYLDAAGRARFTEFWARELDDRSGYVMVVPEESTTDALADAARAIAGGAPIDEAMQHIVAGIAVNPMAADGCVLRLENDRLVAATPWPLSDDFLRLVDRSAPWHLSGRSGVGVDVNDLSDLDDQLRDELRGRGYRSLWCRPVVNRRGEVSAVVVVFRNVAHPPSPNQRRRLDEIVSITALAFDQLEYRTALEHAAFTDPLTGAASRARLHEEVDAGISGAAVVYLDLDGFKAINDTYGHGAGDAVLSEVAHRLASIVRSDDLVVRVGGDEFVLVIRDVSELESVQIAASVVDELSLPYEVSVGSGTGPVLVSATASAGLCVQSEGTPFDLALHAADEALSNAKRAGKRRMHVVSR